jgi:dihydroneopterin aldolase/2-amino-4-hydroxy-6-hydroxymethyldihydropteridine diphosphokinase/dihydropteroate synthase
MDQIIIQELQVRSIIGVDAWERTKKQPLLISLQLFTDFSTCGKNDQLEDSVSYSFVQKKITELAETVSFKSIEGLANAICQQCLAEEKIEKCIVRLEKPKALLHAQCAGIIMTRSKTGIDKPDELFIRDLKLNCIIGINPWERLEKQIVFLNITLYLNLNQDFLMDVKEDRVRKQNNYRTIVRVISQFVENSTFKTVEALVYSVADVILNQCHIPKTTVRIEKPSALGFAKSAGVEITKEYSLSNSCNPPMNEYNLVYIGLGSNIGNRIENIENALDLLEKNGCKVKDTSFLYESKPMYLIDQPMFLNAVCLISTLMKPEELLHALKRIEEMLGRDFGQVKNGPRPVDLDILFYNHLEMKTSKLIIPHPLMQEREFVLLPLCEYYFFTLFD